MDHAGRLSRLRSALGENDLGCLLIAHLPNVHYLCSFTGSAAALLVTDRTAMDRGAILFTDGRYRAQAKEEVNGVRIVIAHKSPLVAATEWLAAERRSSTPVGIEPESITAGMRDRLARMLKGRAGLRSAPPLVERARIVKAAAEILPIPRAAELAPSPFR